jgi:hypothetical protein
MKCISITKIYGSGFGGADAGRHSVTSKIMKDEKAVDAILKIGFFWKMNRGGLYGPDYSVWPGLEECSKWSTDSWGGLESHEVCVQQLKAIAKQFPVETTSPEWIEHKDHMRYLWGYVAGRRAQVLFNQGNLSEEELYDEE